MSTEHICIFSYDCSLDNTAIVQYNNEFQSICTVLGTVSNLEVI